MPWLFLLAYACSGLAGLIYEVSWTRLLTLYIGHTTAAASAVVAAFLGGLAVGAGAGGALASRLTPRKSLQAYIGLEIVVVAAAIVLPFELTALTPLLRWAYQDASPGLLFPAVRVLACLAMVFVPAAALGATFPMAIRWFADASANPARASSALYVVNTVGAAAGSLLAGFVLIPAIGITGTVRVGMAASLVAALSVWVVVRSGATARGPAEKASPSKPMRRGRKAEAARHADARVAEAPTKRWLAVVVLGLSGFAALIHEIAWTRILSLVLGPTTYAFAATLAAVISGVALGSGLGAWLVGRTRRPAAWLVTVLALAAITATWTYAIAGARIPLLIARQVASSSTNFDELLWQGTLLTVALILPTAACLGAAFPLALAIVSDPLKPAAGRFGLVYALNTVGSVSGSLAAGFLLIPRFGLQPTLWVVSGCLVLAAWLVIAWGPLSRNARVAGLAASAVAIALLVFSPPWDRELLASGVYMYAPFVPKDLDLETQLKAGALLYYREGAAATVSVKRLTGTTTLAVDGKTDASNRGDMLTQKLIAHLPLLLHESPKEVAIIGLGSGATLGAALRHPITRADVIEISPEVVEASRYFLAENYDALKDPRTHLIVGDGRSHLLLSGRKYDVIVSEPSNPWIAGVAALFTREFFVGARDRLAPGGIMCQWANAYNISDADLRAIVATFRSVFPDGTVWLAGENDVLLVGSLDFARDKVSGPIDARLAQHRAQLDPARRRGRPEDHVGAGSVFDRVTADGRAERTRGLLRRRADLHRRSNDARVHRAARDPSPEQRRQHGRTRPPPRERRRARVPRRREEGRRRDEWRHRGEMMAKADAFPLAYDDFVRALTADPGDTGALDGLVRTAVLTHRGSDALAWVKSLMQDRPQTAEVLVGAVEAAGLDRRERRRDRGGRAGRGPHARAAAGARTVGVALRGRGGHGAARSGGRAAARGLTRSRGHALLRGRVCVDSR